jgi:hypothetical protein
MNCYLIMQLQSRPQSRAIATIAREGRGTRPSLFSDQLTALPVFSIISRCECHAAKDFTGLRRANGHKAAKTAILIAAYLRQKSSAQARRNHNSL